MRLAKSIAPWLPVFCWAGLIFYLSSVQHLGTDLGVWDLVLRKIAHVVEYAVLSLLVVNAWKRTWPDHDWRKMAGWCFLYCFLYAVSDEIHQAFVPGRGPSIVDVLIDTVGVILGVGGAPFLLKWRHLDENK